MTRLVVKGEEVRRLRLLKAMSQADLADAAGVRQATVSNVERGKSVRGATIAALAASLAVEIHHIAEVLSE